MNVFRFFSDDAFYSDIGNWRRWNLKALLGLLLFYGTINSAFASIHYYTQEESMYGMIAGVLFVILCMDNSFTLMDPLRTKILQLARKTIYRGFVD